MSRRVLDVGNCGADHSAISRLLRQHFEVAIVRADDLQETITQLQQGPFDLVTVNRIMDRDGSHGIDIIRAIKTDAQWSNLPVMMITNFEQHQRTAVEAGAEPGFGKNSLFDKETIDRLRAYLG